MKQSIKKLKPHVRVNFNIGTKPFKNKKAYDRKKFKNNRLQDS